MADMIAERLAELYRSVTAPPENNAMATHSDGPTPRQSVQEAAEKLLRSSATPMHYKAIAQSVLPALGLTGRLSAKDLNTALHEDKLHRFIRVGKGTWTVAGAR